MSCARTIALEAGSEDHAPSGVGTLAAVAATVAVLAGAAASPVTMQTAFPGLVPATPAPLSTLFQPGTWLDGCNEDLMLIAGFIAILGVIDVVIVQPCVHPKARFFFLHACANAVATVASAPDVWRGLTAPATSWTGCVLAHQHCSCAAQQQPPRWVLSVLHPLPSPPPPTPPTFANVPWRRRGICWCTCAARVRTCLPS